jgi:hypothetical protein
LDTKRSEFAAKGSTYNESYKFWRNGNHPEEIYSSVFFWTKLNYIHMNPFRSGLFSNAYHYLYCSASNYILGKGLIEVEIQPAQNIFVNSKQLKIDYDLW